MSRSVRIPIPACSESVTTAAPTCRADIWREASRSVCAGPTVRTTLVIPSRTFMIARSPPACELVTTIPPASAKSSLGARPVGAVVGTPGGCRRDRNAECAARSSLPGEEVEHPGVQAAVAAHHAAAVRRGLAGQVGERAARLLDDDLQ